MGLLDSLLASSSADYSGQNGGLLDMLRRAQMQQAQYQPSVGFQPDPNQAQPIAIGSGTTAYQMPRIGSADQFMPTQDAAIPQNAQPTQGQLPQDQFQLPASFGQPGGNNFLTGLQSVLNGGGLISSIRAAQNGQRADPAGVQQQNLKAQYDSLVPVLGPQKALLAVMNPEAGKTLLSEALTNKEEFKTIKDGLGVEHPAFVNTREQTINGIPIADYNKQSSSTSGLGDMSKSGQEYLATLPKQVQGTVIGMLDGTIQPPSSFAAAKPYWQGMLAAAKNVDPTFDENVWNARRKLSTDMAASGNSSMGGILSNGKSAFKHLAEYTGSAADLGNASHNFPGGGIAANVQNYVGNKLAGSDTQAKIKAINDNLGHYGQESTKFYAGTGGGVEERMNALKEMNPTITSSAEMAAYAEKEKSLMLDRLREKEAQIRDTMGEAYLQKHPVFTPELQRDISRIDANVSKLRGGVTATPSSLPNGWSVKVH